MSPLMTVEISKWKVRGKKASNTPTTARTAEATVVRNEGKEKRVVGPPEKRIQRDQIEPSKIIKSVS